jgi:dolichol-phosphate mannosyltransferase
MQAIVVLPTYNERDNLPVVVSRIREVAPGLHILVVDDNSPDGTGALADELSAGNPGTVFVLHRARKAGLGAAYVAGFGYALDQGYESILQMDADLSHRPEYLPEFLSAIRDCDLAIGSRYVNGINVVGWDFKRLLLSKFASIYVRVVTGLPVTDATGGFKCWRRRALASVDLNSVFSNGYLFQVETTFKAFRNGFSIRELPIVFYERSLGRSKLDRRIVAEAVFGVMRLRVQSWTDKMRGKKKTPEPIATNGASMQ